jgi:putative peptidoglycan lipid II flippase
MKGLKTVLLLTIPSAIAFVALNEPIIRTIFKFTNKFNEASVGIAASILMLFSIALVTQSIVTILNRAFYSLNDTKTPLYVGSATIIVNLAFSYAFYKLTNMGVSGMALSYSIASSVNAFLLLIILNGRVKGLDLREFFRYIFKIGVASGIMGAALFLCNSMFQSYAASKVMQLIVLSSEVIVGMAIYSGTILMMKIKEAVFVMNMIKRRLGR